MTIDPNWMAAPGHGGPQRKNRKPNPLPLHAAHLWAERPPGHWLIPGLIPERSLGSITAESGAGKTAFLSHVGHLAPMGGEWNGDTLRPFSVVYIAAENPDAVAPRFAAEQRRLHTKAHGLFIMPDPINLLDSDAGLRLCDTVDRCEELSDLPCGLLIVDTVRDAWGGNEDSSQEVGRLFAPLKAVRDKRRTSILFAHHCGHGGDRERGSYHWRANVDFAWHLSKDETELRTLECRKMRSFPLQPKIAFTIKDPDGDYGVTIVEAPTTSGRKPKLSGQKALAFSALHDAAATHGEPLPPSLGLPAGLYGVPCSTWRQAFYDRLGDIKADTTRQAFNRALSELQKANIVGVQGYLAWPVTGHRDGQDISFRNVRPVTVTAAPDSPDMSRNVTRVTQGGNQ